MIEWQATTLCVGGQKESPWTVILVAVSLLYECWAGGDHHLRIDSKIQKIIKNFFIDLYCESGRQISKIEVRNKILNLDDILCLWTSCPKAEDIVLTEIHSDDVLRFLPNSIRKYALKPVHKCLRKYRNERYNRNIILEHVDFII